MKLEILYEDNDCLFINKPSGISVHGDGKTEEVTLADILLEQYPEMKDVGEPLEIKLAGGESKFVIKPGIVHRLDKETSGVMVVAKTVEAHAFLKKQFQEHNIKKIYHAFVYGWLKEDTFEVNEPIGRDSGNIRRWTTSRNARGTLRESQTTFTVLSRFADPLNSREYEGKGSTEAGTFTFLEAMPKTGRTHQIRVHIKSVNHPIVSDSLYAPGRPAALGFERLALHARTLSLAVPKGDFVTITAPYPNDFENAVKVANVQ
jgi:23S rRNA pseudouridine1911/1915/1917 synthase